MSTSLNLQVALRFAKNVLFVIKVPPGVEVFEGYVSK